MYGGWMLITFGGLLAVILLAIALAASAWVPILGAMIALVLGAVIVSGFAVRRSREVGRERETAGTRPGQESQAGEPDAGGAPASGEG